MNWVESLPYMHTKCSYLPSSSPSFQFPNAIHYEWYVYVAKSKRKYTQPKCVFEQTEILSKLTSTNIQHIYLATVRIHFPFTMSLIKITLRSFWTKNYNVDLWHVPVPIYTHVSNVCFCYNPFDSHVMISSHNFV